MLYAFLSALAIAIISLIGIIFLGNTKTSSLIGRYVVPVAIGVFLGVIFFELIPETLELGGEAGIWAMVIGFLSFYALSHLLHTYHHHHQQDDGCEHKAGASMLLVGDAIHNLADGIVIATAFIINPAVGIATTIGIALHEIPQEIAEYGVLIKAGYSKTKALFLNFLSASSVIVGVLLTYVFSHTLEDYLFVLTGLAAGNLLYIAVADLLPNEHSDSRSQGRMWQSLIATLIGLLLIVAILEYSHEHFGHTHEDDHDHTSEKTISSEHLETEADHDH